MHVWSINGDVGLALPNGVLFEALMHYEIVHAETEWKISTRSYFYRLVISASEVFAMHWHPTGESRYVRPHVHLRPAGTTEGTAKLHMPTGRLSFEEAVEWAINCGLPPARDDWRQILDGSKKLHIQHRSWNNTPDEAAR